MNIPQIPFHKEGDKVILDNVVFLSCGCGSQTARFATIQQNLLTRIAQVKPKASQIAKQWIEQEKINVKYPILTKHQFGLVIAETENGWEGIDIMGGATMKIVEQIADLIRRHNEFRRIH